jgi:hypothetical protein
MLHTSYVKRSLLALFKDLFEHALCFIQACLSALLIFVTAGAAHPNATNRHTVHHNGQTTGECDQARNQGDAGKVSVNAVLLRTIGQLLERPGGVVEQRGCPCFIYGNFVACLACAVLPLNHDGVATVINHHHLDGLVLDPLLMCQARVCDNFRNFKR